MNYRALSRGLGWFSIALGAAELLGSSRITRALGVKGGEGVVKAFGAREVATGAGLLKAPAHATRMWGRVAGDALDFGAVALVARKSRKRGALIGAAAFVAGAALIDTIVARGLGKVPDLPANGPAAA
jgi:hypothetical protein